MYTRVWVLLLVVLLQERLPVLADSLRVDCDQGHSLARALAKAKPRETIMVRGTCQEAVTITTDRLTLDGGGTAIIDGGGTANTVTVDSARGVAFTGFTVRHGVTGIVVQGAASLVLRHTTVQGNTTGIRVDGHSSLEMRNCTTQENEVNGLEVNRASEVQITEHFRSRHNGVFGIILNNNSSLLFTAATAEVSDNILGIQIGINSSASIADAATMVTTNNNLTTGLTVVSGSTLFVFEGKIVSQGNTLNHGVSANSRSNIDLDRGGSITVRNNGQDGIQLEDSLLNLFNMPGLRGSTVVATNNSRHGLSAFVGSKIDLSGDSVITSRNNSHTGLFADNGGSVRIINSDIRENATDVALSFGVRADLTANTIGTIVCDATVLIRGDTGTVCLTP
jgi:hypothetical protein